MTPGLGRFLLHAMVLIGAGSCVGAGLHAQTPAPVQLAPASSHFERVWHFGRTTGDLSRIIAFYDGLLGLELRGARDQRLPFLSSPALNEFVAAPASSQFRAVHLSIPGAGPSPSASLEAFEYCNVDRRQVLPPLSAIGVPSLRFFVRDLDAVVAAARAADVSFITEGGAPLRVPPPPGFEGDARAVMVRDPDGYPVELMQLRPDADSIGNAQARVLGAATVVVVADLEASLRFYREFIGEPVTVSPVSAWSQDDGIERVRGVPAAEHRRASIMLPGTTLRLELLQFRVYGSRSIGPCFRISAPGTSRCTRGTWRQLLPRYFVSVAER